MHIIYSGVFSAKVQKTGKTSKQSITCYNIANSALSNMKMTEILTEPTSDAQIIDYAFGSHFSDLCTPIADGYFNTVYQYGDGACVVKVPKDSVFGRFTYDELREELDLCEAYDLPIPNTAVVAVPEADTAVTISEPVTGFRNLRFSDLRENPRHREAFLDLLDLSAQMRVNDEFSIDFIGIRTFLRYIRDEKVPFYSGIPGDFEVSNNVIITDKGEIRIIDTGLINLHRNPRSKRLLALTFRLEQYVVDTYILNSLRNCLLQHDL